MWARTVSEAESQTVREQCLNICLERIRALTYGVPLLHDRPGLGVRLERISYFASLNPLPAITYETLVALEQGTKMCETTAVVL